jgi:hypothetical protein
MKIEPHNPYGVVMAYVIANGQEDLKQLFAEFGIPAEPTPANIKTAILKYRVPFLHQFNVRIIRPYSKQLFDQLNLSAGFSGSPKLQNFGPSTQFSYLAASSPEDVKNTAEYFASVARDPNRGNNIITGASTAVDMLGTFLGGFQQIRNTKNPQPVYVDSPPARPNTALAKEGEEGMNKTFLYIGIGVVLLIVGLFAYMKLKK